jgi:hypothetical protein
VFCWVGFKSGLGVTTMRAQHSEAKLREAKRSEAKSSGEMRSRAMQCEAERNRAKQSVVMHSNVKRSKKKGESASVKEANVTVGRLHASTRERFQRQLKKGRGRVRDMVEK